MKSFPLRPRVLCRFRILAQRSRARKFYASLTILRMSALSQPATHEFNPRMVTIPAGWFLMGSDVPARTTSVPCIASGSIHFNWRFTRSPTPPTVSNSSALRGKLSAAVLAVTPAFSGIPGNRWVGVSWHEATGYCDWLSKDDQPLLPPAHRGRVGAPRPAAVSRGALFPWGDGRTGFSERTTRRDGKSGPEPVVYWRLPMSYGLVRHGAPTSTNGAATGTSPPDYYADSPERNPRGPETGVRRASRGGSWRHHIKVTRCAARSSIPPHLQDADYGFRVACVVDER